MVFGIGIDAVSIERMAEGAIKEHAVLRMFHPSEVATAGTLHGGVRAQFLASRFAAKEALGKALGCGLRNLVLSEIAVVSDENGRPTFHLDGSTARQIETIAPRCRILLSLTHEPPLALAQVVITTDDAVPSREGES
jgi:holo-[acyl-carrier protein] synthase